MFARYTYSAPIGLVYFIPVRTTQGGTSNAIFATTTLSYLPEDLVHVVPGTIYSSTIQIVVKKQVNGFGVNSFQITLVDFKDDKGRTWLDKVYPHDLVAIFMGRPGVDQGLLPVMLGVVKSITKTVGFSGSAENPSVERQIVVSGLEIVGLSASHFLYSNASALPAISKLRELLGWPSLYVDFLQMFTETAALEVHDAVMKYFKDLLLQDLTAVTVPYAGGRTLDTFITVEGRSFRLDEGQPLQIYGMAYSTFSGSGAQFLDQVLQKPFNEIITRTIIPQGAPPGAPSTLPKCKVIIRPSPFKFKQGLPFISHGNLEKWIGAVDPEKVEKVHVVRDIDVYNESIGRGSEFEHNLFLVAPNTSEAFPMALELNVEPVADLEHIRRHGLNPIIMKFDYFNTQEEIAHVESQLQDKGTAVVQISDATKTLANRLADVLKQWYIKSCEFLRGTLQIRGTASINEGDAVLYVTNDYGGEGERYLLFYVDSVTHVFINFETFLTNLELSRGIELTKEEAGKWLSTTTA
jgi:hypothetical protein